MLKSIIDGIDWLVEKQGVLTSYIVYPLVFIVLYEVIMRYVFNSPTVWGFEATTFVYGLHYMFGLSFMERYEGHVRVDIVTSRLSEKTQAVIAVITYFVIFLPIYFFMTVGAIKFAHTSTLGKELNSTSWAPPIWPFKILMALCFVFLVLQGFATMLKYLRRLSGGDSTVETG